MRICPCDGQRPAAISRIIGTPSTPIKKLQGGFVWDWVDQTVIQKDAQGREYWAQGPDFANKGGDDSPVGDGVIRSDRTPDPEYYELAKVQSPIAFEQMRPGFAVTNRHDHIDLSRSPWLDDEEDGRAVATGTIPTPQAARRRAVSLNLPTARGAGRGAERILVLRARAKAGAIPMVPAGMSSAGSSSRRPAARRARARPLSRYIGASHRSGATP